VGVSEHHNPFSKSVYKTTMANSWVDSNQLDLAQLLQVVADQEQEQIPMDDQDDDGVIVREGAGDPVFPDDDDAPLALLTPTLPTQHPSTSHQPEAFAQFDNAMWLPSQVVDQHQPLQEQADLYQIFGDDGCPPSFEDQVVPGGDENKMDELWESLARPS